ncbi:MAG: hypothetical protein LC647_03290, partial [Beggiatoa sp.]|nr:hypothetical protein [Beggiatoa sp.]
LKGPWRASATCAMRRPLPDGSSSPADDQTSGQRKRRGRSPGGPGASHRRAGPGWWPLPCVC